MSSSLTTRILGAVELHFGAGVLAEQHLVADLDLRRAGRTVVERLAFADGDDFALDRLLGGRVRDHDAAGGHLFFFHALDDDAVVQRLDVHGCPLSGSVGCGTMRLQLDPDWAAGSGVVSTRPR